VATSLLKGRFTLGELEDAALHDAAVLNLASRVEYEADPASTFPRHYTGEVIVDTKDGRSLRHREGINRGCADRPLTNDEIVVKFLDTAQRAVSRPTAENVLNAVVNFDRESAHTLADALCAEG
jgi:2-methylcitrate dehydratase PrpD